MGGYVEQHTYRYDLGTHAHRLSQCIGKLEGRRGDSQTVELVSPAGIVTETVNDFLQVAVEGVAVRLAVVPRLNGGEDLLVLLDEIGKSEQEQAPLSTGHVPPRLVVQGSTGSGDGLVDILGASCFDGADFLLIAVGTLEFQ